MSDNKELEIDIDEGELDQEFEQQPQTAPVKKKKSGGGFFKLIVVLLLAGGGGYYYLQMTGTPLPINIPGLSASQQNMAEQQQQPAATQQPAQNDAMMAEAMPPMPKSTQETSDPMMVAEEDPLAMPEEIEGTLEEGNVPLLEDFNTPVEDVEGAEAMAPSIPGMNGSDPDMTISEMPTNTSDMEQSVESSAEADVDPLVWGGVNEEGEVSSTASEMQPAEEMTLQTAEQHSLPKNEQEPDRIQDTMVQAEKSALQPAQQSALQGQQPVVDTSRLETLEDRMAKLEDMLKRIESKMVDTSQLNALRVEIGALEQDIANQEPVSAPAPTPQVKQEQTDAAAPKEEPEMRQKVSSGLAPKWVLRSAKPGQAWVSESGSNEMRSIAVGDVLAGIGKIESISLNDQKKWVVKGTRGNIAQ